MAGKALLATTVFCVSRPAGGEWGSMVKLYEGGVYLRGGKELVRESDAAAAGIAATPE